MRKSIEKTYLTTRLLVSKSKKAVSNASEKALKLVGSTVEVEGDQVVRIFENGKKEIILELSKKQNNQSLHLD